MDPIARPARRFAARDESGNILVLFAVLIPVFVLLCAVVIDVGYWFVNARKAQTAADACALAAAGDVGFPKPYNLTHCQFGAPVRDYVKTNLHLQADPSQSIWHKSTRVIAPYKTDPKRVEATVEIRVNTFFGTYVGLDYVDIERRAVAEKLEDAGNWAIYAHDPDFPSGDACIDGEGLEINGAGIQVNGRVHSNSNYSVNSGHPSGPPNPPGTGSGDQFWAAEATINSSMCQDQLDPDPTGAVYGSGPEPRDWEPQDGTFEPWPSWYTPTQFNWPTCSGATFSARIINIKGDKVELKGKTIGGGDQDINHSGTVPSGTYCARESISTSDNVRGQVTLLAPQITIGGGTVDFTPHSHNVLFFSIPNWFPNGVADIDTNNDGAPGGGGNLTCTNRDVELIVNAAFVKFAGTIFHPCGRVAFNSGAAVGGNPQLVGTILGYKVKINMSSFKMVGLDEFGGNTQLALWE